MTEFTDAEPPAMKGMARRLAFEDPTEGGLINQRIVIQLLTLAQDHSSATEAETIAFGNILFAAARKLVTCWKHLQSYLGREKHAVVRAQKPLDASESVRYERSQDLLIEVDDFFQQASSCVDVILGAPRVFAKADWGRKKDLTMSQALATLKRGLKNEDARIVSMLTEPIVRNQSWLDGIHSFAFDGIQPEAIQVVAARREGEQVVHTPRFSDVSVADGMGNCWRNLAVFAEEFLGKCLALRMKPAVGLRYVSSPFEPNATFSWTPVAIPEEMMAPANSGKLDRNDPCHCGSGKKYKKCHLDEDRRPRPKPIPVSLETLAVLKSTRPIIQVPFQGQRARVVGNQVVLRPEKETFHEFLWAHLRNFFGVDWFETEESKPAADRHTVWSWFNDLSTWRNARIAEGDHGPRGVTPSGNVHALATLAYDVYTLVHDRALPGELRVRLLDRHEFQGARYELAVAAIVRRAEFSIEFLKDTKVRHGEFVAVDKRLGIKVAVEAKSRRRPGVLHEKGKLDPERVVRGDVQALFEQAKAQFSSDLPFLIFVDLNSPPETSAGGPSSTWFKDLETMFETHEAVSDGKPDVFNALCVTNFATHYFGDSPIATEGERLLIRSAKPRVTLAEDALGRIWAAVGRYGGVPMDPPEELAHGTASWPPVKPG